MARVKLINKDFDELTGVCTFEAMTSGASVKEGESVEFNVNELSDTIQKFLKCHGAIQKVGDNYAGAGGDMDKAWGLCKEMIAQLKEGIWETRGQGGEGAVRISLLAEAVARIKNQPVEDVRKALAAAAPESPGDEATEEEQKAYTEAKEAYAKKMAELRKHPTVKRVILEIQLEREKAAEAGAASLDSLMPA